MMAPYLATALQISEWRMLANSAYQAALAIHGRELVIVAVNGGRIRVLVKLRPRFLLFLGIAHLLAWLDLRRALLAQLGPSSVPRLEWKCRVGVQWPRLWSPKKWKS